MVNNDSNTLSIIKQTASKIIPGCKVLLFGSRARNDNDNESDYDFLVISDKTLDTQIKRSLKSILRKELARYKIPADVFVFSQEEINNKKEITGHIIKQILIEGVAI